nr:hypothetical protein [Neisseria iguanae]
MVMLFQISENLLGAEFQDEQDIDVFCEAFGQFVRLSLLLLLGGVTVLCSTGFVYAIFALVSFDFPNNAVFAAVECSGNFCGALLVEMVPDMVPLVLGQVCIFLVRKAVCHRIPAFLFMKVALQMQICRPL